FVDAKFVEVVVGRNLLPGIRRFGRAQVASSNVFKLPTVSRRLLRFTGRLARERPNCEPTDRGLNERPAVQVRDLIRDLRTPNVRRGLDQHDDASCTRAWQARSIHNRSAAVALS